jgi:ectoine hydroxylase-related dioxygenase (phytanoyl-CoA dioxygenase family)
MICRQAMTQVDQGYSIVEQVFARTEMAHVLEELSAASPERTKAGARHILSVPVVRGLSADPRMLEIAGEFVGPAPVAFRATLFDKSPGANWLVAWHQDTGLPLRHRIEHAEWGPWSVKAGVLYGHAPAWALEQVVALRVSLDDSSSTNGPLRVLPGSHRAGVCSDAHIEQLVRYTDAVDCVVASGGVVAMRPLTIHASSKSLDARPRRVLRIEYAASVHLAPGVELAVA